MKKDSEIIQLAERMIRAGGFNAFSFREIAKAIGIKSSSVHYHFPTKADLAVAVARRYTDRFMAAVQDGDEGRSQKERLQHYLALFRESLHRDKAMCLCGVLGAEAAELPEAVREETKRFFQLNIEWLTLLFANSGEPDETVRQRAISFISALEGAMLISRTLDDDAIFDAALAELSFRFQL